MNDIDHGSMKIKLSLILRLFSIQMVRVSEVRMGAGEMPQAAIFPSKRPDGKHWDRPKIWGPKTKVGYYVSMKCFL